MNLYDIKIKEYKNGSWVTYEKQPNFYILKLYKSNGELYDKLLVDDYRSSREYFRAFCAIAKNGGA